MYVDMPSYPTLPPLRVEQLRTVKRNGSNVSIITCMHMHLGTHIDFPLHMVQEAKASDGYTLEDLSGEGVVMDISYKGEGEEITEEDLAQYDDQVKVRDMTFIFTGWSKKRSHTTTYLSKWPYIGEEAAHFLVNKNIKLVGVDTLSIGKIGGKITAKEPPTKPQSQIVHKIFLEAGIPAVEEVANLDKVLMGNKAARGFFVVAPLAIKDVEASPCRVFMILGL